VKKILKTRFINLALLFFILFSWTVAFGNIPSASAQSTDNWNTAVFGTQLLLQKNPDFQTHLTEYAQNSASITSSLGQLKTFEDFINTTKELQTTAIPRLGNGWDELIKAMNAYKAASGDGLSQFLTLTGQMITLSETPLPGVLDTNMALVLSGFNTKPDKSSLLDLDAQAQLLSPSLVFLQAKNKELYDLCNQLSQTIELSISGLDFEGYAAQSPQIIEYVNLAKSELPLVSNTLKSVMDQSSSMATKLGLDIKMLADIHAKVVDAQHLDSLNTPQVQEVKTSLWPFIGLGATLVIGIFVLVFVLATRSKKGTKKGGAVPPPLVITGQKKSSLSSDNGFKYDLAGESIRIGRGEDCELRIADPAISRLHATLRYAEGAWYIQDSSSTAGVFVNGQRVQASRLNHGDKVGIGRTVLTFKEESK
jgi:hypothetical protein